MPSYQTRVTVARPISEVFAYIVDVGGWPNWMNVEAVRPVEAGAMQIGSRSEGRVREGGSKVPFSMEITELEPGRRIGFRTLSGPVEWTGRWELRAIDDATTEIAAEGVIRLRGIRRLLEPFMGGEVRRNEEAELVKLRALLEGGTEAVGGS